VYVISGLNAGELTAKFYFDKYSGLLLRMLRYVNSPLGQNPTQIDYADYREQDGMKMPFLQTVSRFRSRLVIQIDEAKYNVPVNDTKFARPAGPSTDTAASP
jgi:photosynthetic reaction center cytochrome c subunit